MEVKAPNINLKGSNLDNIISGIILGSKPYKTANIIKSNIDFWGEIKTSNNLNGSIPGIK